MLKLSKEFGCLAYKSQLLNISVAFCCGSPAHIGHHGRSVRQTEKEVKKTFCQLAILLHLNHLFS